MKIERAPFEMQSFSEIAKLLLKMTPAQAHTYETYLARGYARQSYIAEDNSNNHGSYDSKTGTFKMNKFLYKMQC